MQNLSLSERSSLYSQQYEASTHTNTSLLQRLKMFLKKLKPSRKRKVTWYKQSWNIAMTIDWTAKNVKK